jgi:hypothetical protein
MFNLSEEQKAKARSNSIKAKEMVLYKLLLDLGIDPDSIPVDGNIPVPNEADAAYPLSLGSSRYAPSIVAYYLIEEIKALRQGI